MLALALLIGLQFVITWSSVRAGWVRRLVTGEPTLLLLRGEIQRDALRRTRVAEDEVLAAVRSAGLGAREEAEVVVLETDGSFSVLRRGSGTSALAGVEGAGGRSARDETRRTGDVAGARGARLGRGEA